MISHCLILKNNLDSDNNMSATCQIGRRKNGILAGLFACGCDPGDKPSLMAEKYRVGVLEMLLDEGGGVLLPINGYFENCYLKQFVMRIARLSMRSEKWRRHLRF